jgi:hypothetical protein
MLVIQFQSTRLLTWPGSVSHPLAPEQRHRQSVLVVPYPQVPQLRVQCLRRLLQERHSPPVQLVLQQQLQRSALEAVSLIGVNGEYTKQIH